MRIVEKLLYGICGIIGLMLLFILLCHFNPTIAKGFAGNVEAKATDNTVQNKPAPIVNETKPDVISPNAIQNLVLGTSEYEVPDISALEIPDIVRALMGMEIPIGTKTDVSQKRAEELKEDLTKGELGEDFSYDKKFYPYYHMLNEEEQKLYRQIHANANNLLARFAPVNEKISQDSLQRAFTAVINDHPEIFWINTGYGFFVDPSKNIIEIDLNYNFTAKDLETHKSKFEEAANDIVYGSRGASGEYGKEVYVHDKIAEKTVYDLNAPANQSAYSALVTGRTVCAGYARAFQYVMQKLEIPTYYCTGFSGENHAWNITKIEGDFYNVDVTWDDQNPEIYDYFNKSDAAYKKDHVRRDMAVNLPPCLGEKYSDLEKNKEPDKQEDTNKDKKDDDKENVIDKLIGEIQNEITTSPVTTEEVKVVVTPPHKLNYHIFDNEDEYLLECAHRMMEDKDNSISFDLYLEDEELWNDIKELYINGDFKSAYLDRVIAERHAKGATVSVTGEVLSDGTVKVRHKYQLY